MGAGGCGTTGRHRSGGGWAGWSSLRHATWRHQERRRSRNQRRRSAEVFTISQNAPGTSGRPRRTVAGVAWGSLGNPAWSALGAPSVAANADSRLEVFAAGLDDALFHIWQTAPDSGWSGWDSLGGEPANHRRSARTPTGGSSYSQSAEPHAQRGVAPLAAYAGRRVERCPAGLATDQLPAGPAHQLFVTSSNNILARTDTALFRSTGIVAPL